MSIKGDLAAALVSQYQFSWPYAKELVGAVLDAADDPNFAMRYAKEASDPEANKDENDLMLNYWDVVKFLKWSNE